MQVNHSLCQLPAEGTELVMRQSPPLPGPHHLDWPMFRSNKIISSNQNKSESRMNDNCCRDALLAKMMSWPRESPLPSARKMSKKMHRNSPYLPKKLLLSSSIVLLLSVALASGLISASSDKSQQPTAATNAYGEPIKWSFGGWAPLDGQQPGGKRNQSAVVVGSTTPLPPMDAANPHRTTAASNQAFSNRTMQQHNSGSKRRQAGESLSESASSNHGKVQFIAPEVPPTRQGAARQHHHIHSGPAYALSMQRPSHQFSPPAPMPIVREHLLPAAANYHHQQHHRQQQQQPQPHGPHTMAHHQHRIHHHQQQQQRQQEASQMIAQHQYPRPPMSIHEHQRRLEQQHRQQMMRHHQMMMQHQQQHRQPDGRQMPMHQPPPPPQYHEPKMGNPHSAGRHTGGFQKPPMIEGYRVVEGEHPILFTPPAGMIEHPALNHTAEHMQHQQHTATSHAPYASTMTSGGGDKEPHVEGYQSALRQVQSGYEQQQQQQQSNNIQDIKQKQQQQQPNKQQEHHHKTGSGYLTIPVAVETEGDKVLTADDINEIEKHVIQVLPNLKTADKVVKLADTKLTLASANQLKEAIQQTTNAALNPTTAVHEQNYQEHRSTMKQLENDAGKQFSQQYESSTTAMPSTASSPQYSGGGGGSSSTPALNQATTNAHVQHQQPMKSIDDGQQLPEHQYFLATGPMQEVGTVDPDQLAEYNLIKNDLLQNFRYEPTRASSSNTGAHRQQQTASTPPMPYTQQSNAAANQQPARQQQHRPASVTRYFQQGNSMYQQHQLVGEQKPRSNNNNYHQGAPNGDLFGRLNGPPRGQYNQPTSTTKTILGGRKVSEVMRNLIHTTPVPMTSPMHVPSVEPEKVDAIQLIASHGNDNKPMVVEPHQLVQHTPEGGFDYSSGMNANANANNTASTAQYEPQNSNAVGGQRYNSPAPQMVIEHQQQQPSLGDSQQQQQQQPGGAIIEYVTVGEQALNGVLGSAVQNEGTYEIANQPEVQPVYQHNPEERQQQQHHHHRQSQQDNPNDVAHSSRAPFVYDYTMSADQQQTVSPGGGSTTSEQSGPAAYSMSPSMQQNQHQQQQAGEPQMFTWSPSIANEHQQQQAELSEHAAPMDMPATAGYNFFGQSGDLQQPSQEQQGQEYEQQQQQYQEQGKWRSKAGGSQPNPDAQYDGQIVKGDHESTDGGHDETQNNQHQSADEQQQQQQYNSRPAASDHLSTRQPENQGDSGDAYQQQQKQQQHAQQQGYQQQQESPTTPANQQLGDGYLATNSYVAGAQLNHQTPSNGNYEQQQQLQDYDQSSRQQPARYNYVKLDHDRQQAHLAQHQAQRQAQMAELMSNNQQQQQIYQTTTPVSLTTLASVADANQRQISEDQIQQQQQQQQQPPAGNSNDYGAGQDQSLPSVQSSPESMLLNESPMSMPILDQQSLISDPNQDSQQQLSSDDGGANKQGQPSAVYQVYQAYYAPKDHKPLPGYVRLSLEEFNELFRDAEIQYVDKNNLNGMANAANTRQHQSPDSQQQAYESAPNQNDLMKASASEQNQSIVVDRRSISPERRSSSSNATESVADSVEVDRQTARKLKFGGAVKKIISIRNSRQAVRQQLLKGSLLKHKQQTSSYLEAAGSTITPSFSTPALSGGNNKHPTTKQQQPNVSANKKANITHNQTKNNKQQQPTNKRKPNQASDAATSAKKPLATVQPTMKATAPPVKDNKGKLADKSKPSSTEVKRTNGSKLVGAEH